MKMTQQKAEQSLVSFLLEKLGRTMAIEPDLDLIDSRVITSMGFMNFILLVEELTGIPIAMEEMNVDDFRTLRAIRARFLSVLPSEPEAPPVHESGVANV